MILAALLALVQDPSVSRVVPPMDVQIRSQYGCHQDRRPILPLRENRRADDALASEPLCPAVSTIDTSTLGGLSARTLSEALAGRVPGVTVLRSSGVLGAGSRVRMRGGSGLLIPREPLLIVDGLRVDASQGSLGIDIGGQTPSRLDDFPLDEIERIETLRGPSASALFGMDAAGGAIVVTTKRGPGYPAGWSAYAESGLTNDVTSYPANVATGPPSYGRDTCTRAEAAIGGCTPGPLSQWNPLERASPFRTGVRVASGVTARGGWRVADYFAAASASSDQGSLAPNDARKYSGRVNLDVRPLRSLRVGILGSHAEGRTTFPLGDGAAISALLAGLAGNTADDPVRRGYLSHDVATIASVVTQQHVERSLGSVSPEWSPARWLSVRGVIGREILRRNDSRTLPMTVAYSDPAQQGSYNFEGNAGRDLRTTLGAAATASYPLTRTVHGTTTVGAERLTQSFRLRDSTYVLDGNETPVAFGSFASRTATKSAGIYAAQRLAWNARELTIGVRRDNADRRRLLESATYWSANARWDVSAERFFRRSSFVGMLVLRAAYGVAGDTRPLDVVLAVSPPLPPPLGERPVVLSFAPERVSELEIGVEAILLSGRLRTDLAWFHQRSRHAYERGCCIGPLGYDTGGGWRSNGVELGLHAHLFETLTSEGDASLTFAHIVNKYDRAPDDRFRPIDRAAFFGDGGRRLVRGYPIGGIWSRSVTGSDANNDGVIDATEIIRSADTSYVGPSIATREAALTTSLRLLRRVTLSAQLDYRGGFKSLNMTELYRCEIGTCAALYDPQASVAEQTRAVNAFSGGAGFTERGDFLRLRELAVTWVLAPGWSLRNRLSALTLTIAGRNLMTFTGYSGLDPEVSYAGQSTFGTTEFLTLPLPRTLLVRLSVQRCLRGMLLQCSGFR